MIDLTLRVFTIQIFHPMTLTILLYRTVRPPTASLYIYILYIMPRAINYLIHCFTELSIGSLVGVLASLVVNIVWPNSVNIIYIELLVVELVWLG